MHWWQCMQLPEFQPTPTRCPTSSPLAFGPTAVTRPMTSWPRTAGYCEMPQSLFNTEISEWHKPQCSTAISTSSASNGPRSMVSSTIGCFADFATHALQLVCERICGDRSACDMESFLEI